MERMIKMSLHEFSKDTLNNLALFLDRVPIKGHKERLAMNEIAHVLDRPVEPEKAKAEKKEVTKP